MLLLNLLAELDHDQHHYVGPLGRVINRQTRLLVIQEACPDQHTPRQLELQERLIDLILRVVTTSMATLMTLQSDLLWRVAVVHLVNIISSQLVPRDTLTSYQVHLLRRESSLLTVGCPAVGQRPRTMFPGQLSRLTGDCSLLQIMSMIAHQFFSTNMP